jgi:hypothetical protein
LCLDIFSRVLRGFSGSSRNHWLILKFHVALDTSNGALPISTLKFYHEGSSASVTKIFSWFCLPVTKSKILRLRFRLKCSNSFPSTYSSPPLSIHNALPCLEPTFTGKKSGLILRNFASTGTGVQVMKVSPSLRVFSN